LPIADEIDDGSNVASAILGSESGNLHSVEATERAVNAMEEDIYSFTNENSSEYDTADAESASEVACTQSRQTLALSVVNDLKPEKDSPHFQFGRSSNSFFQSLQSPLLSQVDGSGSLSLRRLFVENRAVSSTKGLWSDSGRYGGNVGPNPVTLSESSAVKPQESMENHGTGPVGYTSPEVSESGQKSGRRPVPTEGVSRSLAANVQES
jgi:hypothetical protein